MEILRKLCYKNYYSDSDYSTTDDDSDDDYYMSDTSYDSDVDMAEDPEGDSLPYSLVDYHIEEELPEDKGKKI